MRNRKGLYRLIVATGVLYITAAFAGGWFEADEKDVRLAVLKANIGALKAAQARGTCMGKGYGYAKSADCKKTQDGKYWACKAEYSFHQGSCDKGHNALQDLQTAEKAVEDFCSKNKSACSSAAAS